MVKKIKCWLFGHKYRVVQLFAGTARRVKCDECGGDWSMCDQAKAFVRWDSEFEDMYAEFGFKIIEPLEPPRYDRDQMPNIKRLVEKIDKESYDPATSKR